MTSRNDKPFNRSGRPSKYRPELCERTRALAQAGAIDAEIAGLLGISLTTLYAWKGQFPEFSDALQRGKDVADDIVEAALFRRATGYSFDAVKIITVPQGANQGSKVEEIPVVEHVPPDVTAAMFWLKNRRPDKWREKQAVEHSGVLSLAELVTASFPEGAGTGSAGSKSGSLIPSSVIQRIDYRDPKQ